MAHILVVEDETIICDALKQLLQRNNYQVTACNTFQEAKLALNTHNFSLIISDVRLPDSSGTEIIPLARTIPVLIITSFASMQNAINAMKLGAADYIAKPFKHEHLLNCVKALIVKSEATSNSTTKNYVDDKKQMGMIGKCSQMQELFSMISKVAPTNSTVLIQGESGTGKELVARALHNLSPRKLNPMICVNCAAIAQSLIESELFGYEKGAFTGANETRAGLIEAADGGTLFLDEIGELPLEAQARMLRVLQEREIRRVGNINTKKVDIRLVTATHRNLLNLVQEGRFRADLFYRLSVINLNVAPLRDRGEDIILLAKEFLATKSLEHNGTKLSFSQNALSAISSYFWPGNVRELKNTIERAVILCDSDEVCVNLLGLNFDLVEDKTLQKVLPVNNLKKSSDNLSLEEYFLDFVLSNQTHMTETELAQNLGISRKTLWERRQKLGIPRKGNT